MLYLSCAICGTSVYIRSRWVGGLSVQITGIRKLFSPRHQLVRPIAHSDVRPGAIQAGDRPTSSGRTGTTLVAIFCCHRHPPTGKRDDGAAPERVARGLRGRQMPSLPTHCPHRPRQRPTRRNGRPSLMAQNGTCRFSTTPPHCCRLNLRTCHAPMPYSHSVAF